ncbi:12818_t:CDS:2, partial [Racocetra fulgida]
MFETVNNKEEIIKVSINLIWKASDGKVVSVSFNDQLRSATIAFDNGTNTTVNLNALGVILMNEETFRKIITEFARKESEEPALIEIMMNDHEITGATVVKAAQLINKIFKSSKRIKKDKQRESVNYEPENNEETEESMTSDLNAVSRMLEQMNLANNSIQADDIESIQDNDH